MAVHLSFAICRPMLHSSKFSGLNNLDNYVHPIHARQSHSGPIAGTDHYQQLGYHASGDFSAITQQL